MTLPRRPVDVAVVGGGIIGTASALFLARAGFDVCLLEQSGLASGASGACEGNLLLWDKEIGRELPLAIRSHELWAQLDDELGRPFEFDRKGSIVFAERPEEMDAVRARVEALSAAGVSGELLGEREMFAEEPALAPGLSGGALFPDDAQVEPRLATVAFARAAEDHGATLSLDTTVVELLRDRSGRVTEVHTDRGRLAAGAFVIAAGVHSGAISRSLGTELPLSPRKGHILVAERTERRFRRKLSEAAYMFAVESDNDSLQVAMVVESTASGTVLIGSSRELSGFDRAVDPAVASVVAARALRFIPSLSHLRVVRAYAGLRPFSADHRPMIGPLPGGDNVFVATGHEGAGISLAPATGELIAAMVRGEPPSEAASSFSPARFPRLEDRRTRSAVA